MDFDGDGGILGRSSLPESGCEPSHEDPECPEPEFAGGGASVMGGCDHLCQASEGIGNPNGLSGAEAR